jgi:cytoskeletal protein RodZ
MSDPHRGAYTPPTDAPLSFDARQPVRGARPLPMTLIISAVVLVTLTVAVVMIYRGGIRNPNEPPQTVGTEVAQMKTPPAAASQPKDPASGLQIYHNEESQPSATFAPPPEAPAARPTAPAPVQTSTLPAAKPTAPAPTIESLATAAAQKPTPRTVQIAQATPPKPVAAAPAPTAAAPKPAAAASGPAAVQIGALSSPALADKAWSDAVRLAPGLAAGKGKKVEAVDKNGTTLYRTSVTGFPSRETAKAFCEAIAASGKSCFVK